MGLDNGLYLSSINIKTRFETSNKKPERRKMTPTKNNTVEFTSIPEIWVKEKKGIKPNTVRYVNYIEPKFIMLKEGKAKYIKMLQKAGFGRIFFIRKIKDITYWKRLVIISW